MEAATGGLTSDQCAQLQTFCEVTGDSRSPQHSRELLASCNWDVEQALQLHLVAGDDANDLGMPLLGGSGDHALLPSLPNGSLPVAQVSVSRAPSQPRRGLFERLAHCLVTVVSPLASLLCLVCCRRRPRGFGTVTGAQFGRALEENYSVQGQIPRFHNGSFVQALQAARQQLKPLVVYIHSDQARHAQHFCTQVLGNELVRGMLDENYVVWGGDIARMESHHVVQMIQARQMPCFSVLVPASLDEVRVAGNLCGEVDLDQVVALLTSCMDDMETQQTQIQSREYQHVEDRNLREQQDQEFQEALALDRLREEAAEAENEKLAEVQRQDSQRLQDKQDSDTQLEEEKNRIHDRRRQQANTLEAAGIPADATARIAMRLPTGQRLDRKFRAETTLADLYAWAECCQYLPENQGKGIEIPLKFALRTAMPSRELTDMQRTVQELQLAGANILLTEIEDD